MTNLKYTFINDVGTKTVTINNVKANIDSDSEAVSAFGNALAGQLTGDYSLDSAVKITIEEKTIEI